MLKRINNSYFIEFFETNVCNVNICANSVLSLEGKSGKTWEHGTKQHESHFLLPVNSHKPHTLKWF